MRHPHGHGRAVDQPELVTPVAHAIHLTGSAVFFTSQRMLSSRVAALILALAKEVRP